MNQSLMNHSLYRAPRNERIALAKGLVEDFVNSTGLLGDPAISRRYLWTDAFAVCNLVSLYRLTQQKRFLQLALKLVVQVHEVLGRHREDDIRTGWLSGFNEHQGRKHPTSGGLRIGKKLMERHATESFDEQLEWSRDGQYFHYLAKWAHALSVIGYETGDKTYHRQAYELIKATLPKFLYQTASSMNRRMYWKMSIDLSRPLVSSMGHLDPLDALIVVYQIQRNYSERKEDFESEQESLMEICGHSTWRTTDMLSIGSLMIEAYRMGQLIMLGETLDVSLLYEVIHGAYEGLSELEGVDWDTNPELRLAFRELGLVIGLKAIGRFSELVLQEKGLRDVLAKSLVAFERFLPLVGVIESFWLAPEHRLNNTWIQHVDINEAMLVTTLLPDGFLELEPEES